MFTLSFCVCTSARCILCAFAYITSNSILCVCIQGAHKTLYTHLASASPHRQTDRQQPFAGYYVCVYTFKLKKKSSALLCVLCNRLDIRRGRKACQFPHAGNTIHEEEENCVYTTLVWLGWEAISRAQALLS